MKKILTLTLLPGMLLLAGACQKPTPEKAGAVAELSADAVKGKLIYEQNKCSRCHVAGENRMKVIEGKEVLVPDLTNPFIAGDSLFVSAHLKFVNETDMPAIELSNDEIHLVSTYVAEMHASLQPPIPASEVDSICPVCSAPVSSRLAREKEHWFEYLGTMYYFECGACEEVFKRAPEAFKTTP